MAMDPPGSTTTTTHINNPSNSSSRRRSRSRCKKWENYLFVAMLLQSVALIVLFEKFQGNVRENKLKHGQEFQATNNNHDNTNDDPNDGQTIITGGVEDQQLPFTFSACLMIKDNNILLPEWLAYHYTVLPLRRLIVGVDTLSHTDQNQS